MEDLEALGYTLETDGERIRYRVSGSPDPELALPLLETLKRIKPYVGRYLLIHQGKSAIENKAPEIQGHRSRGNTFSPSSVQRNVESIFEKHPDARGFDRQLVFYYWL